MFNKYLFLIFFIEANQSKTKCALLFNNSVCSLIFRFRNFNFQRTTFLLFWLNHISRILLHSFRKHKRSQKNTDTIDSVCSYSVIGPARNERALKSVSLLCISLLSVTITDEKDTKRFEMDKSHHASAAAFTFSVENSSVYTSQICGRHYFGVG